MPSDQWMSSDQSELQLTEPQIHKQSSNQSHERHLHCLALREHSLRHAPTPCSFHRTLSPPHGSRLTIPVSPSIRDLHYRRQPSAARCCYPEQRPTYLHTHPILLRRVQDGISTSTVPTHAASPYAERLPDIATRRRSWRTDIAVGTITSAATQP